MIIATFRSFCLQWPLSLTWFNSNPSTDKQSRAWWSVGWNCLSIHKLQLFHSCNLGMDKQFHPTQFSWCYYLSMLGLKLIHVSKRGHESLMKRRYFTRDKYTWFLQLIYVHIFISFIIYNFSIEWKLKYMKAIAITSWCHQQIGLLDKFMGPWSWVGADWCKASPVG